ncbi:unnamed protein product [Orchesella dallaii]|uniref:Odorant receptor n=1 Tax=Orchesella dallaii TaxID=48710 RepID=A0ABP1RVC8_9HEXA
MELGQAFINVHLLQQKFIDLPFHFHKESSKLKANVKLQTRWKMPIWHVGSVMMILFFIFSISHLISLRKFPTNEVAEEAVVYALCSGASLLGIITCYTMEHDPDYVTQLTTETLWAGGIKYKGPPSLKRIPQFPEMFGYGSAAAFHFMPIVAAVFPILRDYDPFSLFFKDILCFSELLRRLMASVTFGIFVAAGAPAICIELLLLASAIVVFGKLLKHLEKLNQNEFYQLDQEGVDWFQQLVTKLLNKLPVSNRVWNTEKLEFHRQGNRSNCPMWFDNSIITPIFQKYKDQPNRHVNQKFREQLHVHNQLYIIMTSCNYAARLFFPLFAFLGITISVAMNYAVIMLYGKIELYLYLFACFIDIICFVLIFFFCHYGAMPLMQSTGFIEFWQGKKMGKAEMKSARAMLPIACMLGHFFSAKKGTSLDIMSNILDYTVSFIVL